MRSLARSCLKPSGGDRCGVSKIERERGGGGCLVMFWGSDVSLRRALERTVGTSTLSSFWLCRGCTYVRMYAGVAMCTWVYMCGVAGGQGGGCVISQNGEPL
jgi:hypothetical protein